VCPFFGTTHQIFPPSEEIHSYLTHYRGYVYYVCSAKNGKGRAFWIAGLCDCTDANEPKYYNPDGSLGCAEINGNI
jgi:hypothetical protein